MNFRGTLARRPVGEPVIETGGLKPKSAIDPVKVETPIDVKATEVAEDVVKNADLPEKTALQEIIDARISGEAPLNRSQMRALEDAYKAKGGDDLSLLKLMGDDGDNFFQEEMSKLASRKKRSSSYSS